MTRKLYYEDPFLKQAQVTVTAFDKDPRGEYVLLAATHVDRSRPGEGRSTPAPPQDGS